MAEINKQEPTSLKNKVLTLIIQLPRSWNLMKDWKTSKFTEMKPAIEEVFLTYRKRTLIELIALLQDGTYWWISTSYFIQGMTSGAFNMDLMLMLVEPTMYLLIAIAEEYEIEPVIYEGQDDDLIDEEDYKQEKDRQTLGKKLPEVRKDSVPESLLQRVKTLPEKEELGIEE